MKELFSGFYKPKDKDFKKHWERAIFVLDANILLNLYRYPEKAREELIKVFESMASRLWVPYQAALEYQRSRLSVIAEQKKRFLDVREILNTTRSSLKTELEQLGLPRRHSFIQTEELLKKINELIDDYLKELTELETKQFSVSDNDPLRDRIDKLFKGRIGQPFVQDKIDQIYESGKERYEQQIPPGYKDKRKERNDNNDCYSYAGIVYQGKFGDLVIWNQMIEKAEKENIESVIFLTDDEKEDWWWIIEGKKLGPRPELIDEIKTKTGVKFFHIYNSEQFLKYSKEYLSAEVSDESISQVHDVVKRSTVDRMVKRFSMEGRVAEKAVYEWLLARYPEFEINQTSTSFIDFIMYNPALHSRIGVTIKIISDPKNQYQRIEDALRDFQKEFNRGIIGEAMLVFILKDKDYFHIIANQMSNTWSMYDIKLTLIFGLLEYDDVDPKGFIKPTFVWMADLSH